MSLEQAARPGTADLQPMTVALLYVFAGEKDRALDWLEKAYQAHDPNLPYLGQPDFDLVRNDPRYRDLFGACDCPVDSPPPAEAEFAMPTGDA